MPLINKNAAKVQKNLHVCKKNSNFAAFFNFTHMRKLFVLAFTAMSMMVMAQHVTPLDIQLAEVNLDSLRTLYQSEPTMYRASLDVVAQQLARNAEDLKTATTELRAEQAHAQEMDNAIKEANKMAVNLKKLYAKEEAELRALQTSVERQQRALTRQTALNDENHENYRLFLEKQQQDLGYALRELAERQSYITDMETAIQNAQTGLLEYMREIEVKQTQITALNADLKQRLTVIKAEQKSARTMQ
jgi:chromosome segregation ATPase